MTGAEALARADMPPETLGMTSVTIGGFVLGSSAMMEPPNLWNKEKNTWTPR
jgi:hypothetical protein